MNKYISVFISVVLCISLLAGCSGKSGKEPESQQTDNQYSIFVLDADTNEPVPGASVQFCSDVQCMMSETDSSGLAAFEADPGTYTVHLLMAPEGYKDSTEEFQLTEESRTAFYYLEKDETESAPDPDTVAVKYQAEHEFPYTGLLFTAPEHFKELSGDIGYNDLGEYDAGSGVVEAYMVYCGRTEAELEEFLNSFADTPENELTEEQEESIASFYSEVPNACVFRVIGLSEDKDKSYLTEEYYFSPLKVCDELGTANGFTYYYVVIDYPDYYWDMLREKYPSERFAELQSLYEEAADTKNFRDRITVKGAKSIYASPDEDPHVSFRTLDLEGTPVTSKDLFAGHKITMINIWATWCNNCIKELDALEKMSKEWAEQDCQIIGLCADATDDAMASAAAKILKKNGVTYLNIRMTDEIKEQLNYIGLPTSYYVDSKGTILDYPIAGAYVEKYPEKLQELLSKIR